MSAETYLNLLNLHRVSVACSLTLFMLRGLGVQSGLSWPMARFWRYASVAIDVVLLAAGAGLWFVMQHNPFREPWLGLKLVLLVLYVVLGSLALKRARTAQGRWLCFAAALLVATTMLTLAIRRPLWGPHFF